MLIQLAVPAHKLLPAAWNDEARSVARGMSRILAACETN